MSYISYGRSNKLYFTGTFIPVEFLWKYLADGYSIEQFIVSYPSLKKEDVISVIREAYRSLEERYVNDINPI